jgi:hypothetical protein
MRKAVHDGLRSGTAHGFGTVQHGEAVLLAINMLSKSDDWYFHCQKTVASTIMQVIYGKPHSDADSNASIQSFHDFVHSLTRAALPGAHMVEIFPWMNYIPATSVHFVLGRNLDMFAALTCRKSISMEETSRTVLHGVLHPICGFTR